MSDIVLGVAELRTQLDTPRGTVHAVDGVDFELRGGECFALVLAANLFADAVRDGFDPRVRV